MSGSNITTGEMLLLEVAFEDTITAVDSVEVPITGEILTATVEMPEQVEQLPALPFTSWGYTEPILLVLSIVAGPVATLLTEFIKATFKVNGTHAVLILCLILWVIYTVVTALLDVATIESILGKVWVTASVAMIAYNYIEGKNLKSSKY